MTVDLIIPVYNNKLGLYRSLFSLGTDNHEFLNVTIVDDASTEDYTSIIEYFQQFIPIRLLKLPQNVGPGMARQYGIDHTKNDYLMFLDCGDYYITPDYIKMIIETIEENPSINLFAFGHMQGPTLNVGYEQNRMHGKIYKRAFLNNHNIRFNPQQSYANEDIGFNMAVKMILYQYEMELNKSFIYTNDLAIIVWDIRDDSLTRKNNNEFYYNIQNTALAINGGYALDIAQREQVNINLRAHQAYEIMCDMYFKFLSTTTIRPEFSKEALYGAVKFYWSYFKNYATVDIADLMKMYYDTLITYLSDEYDPIRTKFNTLDFISFLDLLESKKDLLTT